MWRSGSPKETPLSCNEWAEEVHSGTIDVIEMARALAELAPSREASVEAAAMFLLARNFRARAIALGLDAAMALVAASGSHAP